MPQAYHFRWTDYRLAGGCHSHIFRPHHRGWPEPYNRHHNNINVASVISLRLDVPPDADFSLWKLLHTFKINQNAMSNSDSFGASVPATTGISILFNTLVLPTMTSPAADGEQCARLYAARFLDFELLS